MSARFAAAAGLLPNTGPDSPGSLHCAEQCDRRQREASPLVSGKSANDRNSGACQEFGGATNSDFLFIIKIDIVAKPLPEARCEPKYSGNCAVFSS